MDVICPYCHSYYRIQEKKCIGKDELYTFGWMVQPQDNIYIFFNSPYEPYNGIYNIQAIAGDPKNFIILAKNKSNQDYKFTSDQICDMRFANHIIQSKENINQFIAPECKVCKYNNVEHTPGALIKMIDGHTYKCMCDGSWQFYSN